MYLHHGFRQDTKREWLTVNLLSSSIMKSTDRSSGIHSDFHVQSYSGKRNGLFFFFIFTLILDNSKIFEPYEESHFYPYWDANP